jgi:AcrR family transcriptional regulator
VATVRTPRTAWVDGALNSLAEGGPESIRVEALATSLGVSKGGFYWHFTDRQALLDEMLDNWEKAMVEDVIARVENETGDARDSVRRLFELAPTADFAAELAVRDWARRDKGVAARLRRVDQRRMSWLRSLFADFCPNDDDIEARSMLAYSLLIGGYFISAAHEGKSRSDVFQIALERLIGDWE